MKKVILAVAFVFAKGSIINATSIEVNANGAKEIEAVDACGDWTHKEAHDYSNEGCDYFTVWFAAYGHCIEVKIGRNQIVC
ncbi:hypothetical protein [Tenacibaculum xiamenense]|uniref:hypothetical protein n=1 Tax=Tenacibaculum xiamenense TaxID=1261553 RepID=UPI0038B5BA03